MALYLFPLLSPWAWSTHKAWELLDIQKSLSDMKLSETLFYSLQVLLASSSLAVTNVLDQYFVNS